jgi:hypothetical protein
MARNGGVKYGETLIYLIDKYIHCVDEKIKATNQSEIVIKQEGRRYCLNNKTNTWNITKVTIEKCVINEIGQKGCEAVLIASKENEKIKGYFIELKGCSVGDAMKQIENSLKRTIDDLKGYILFGRIVPTEYKRNKFLDSHLQRLILQFNKLGGNFIIKENLEDSI